MASTFENDLRLEEIGTGEQSGTWGVTTNTNLELIAEAFSYGTEAITTNADTHATVIADGATDEGRSMYLKYTGTLDSTCTITISAGSAGTFTLSKLWLIENATSGGQSIIITSGSGASITIQNGQVKMIATDGAGSGGAVFDLLQDVAIPDLFVDDDLTLQSDGAVVNFGADSDVNLTHVADTGLLLNSTRQLQFGDSGTYIHQSADGVLDLVSDTELELNATTIDINGNVDISGTTVSTGKITADAGIDIDNFNIDGTTIALSSGDMLLDGAGDIILDADGGDVLLKDDGTQYAAFTNSSGNLIVKSGSTTAMTFSGANVTFAGTVTIGSAGISEAELEILDGATVTTAELNIIDGDTSATSTTVADADRVVMNDNGTMVQVAVTDLAAYFDDEITAMPNLVTTAATTVGTLDSGAISSGFGNIDIGSSNLTATGTISLGATSFNDNNITNVGSIQLDSIAGDADTNTSITFSGSDVITMATGGTSALTIDASQNVTIAGDLTVSGDDLTMGTNTAGNLLIADGTNFNSVAVGSLSEISTVANDDVFLAVDTSGGGLKKITRSAIVSGLATSAAISNVSEDSTPQLGGDLDVNGNDIVSASNGNINLLPNGSGKVIMDGNGSSGGVTITDGNIDIRTGTGAVSKVKFYCESSNAHAQTLQAQPHSASSSAVVVLPVASGTLVGSGDSGTVSNAMLAGSIADSKLNTITTADKVSGAAIQVDGATDGTGITVADADKLLIDDGGTTKYINASQLNTYISASASAVAADNITTGDAAVTLATSTGNITIDAQGGDTDIIFKGTDGSSDITALTLDMSEAGAATFNDKIVATELDISGNVDIDGTLETDAFSINGTAVTSTAAELNILDGVTSTAAELNIMDGNTSATSTTVADADRVVLNDNGTMVQVAVTDLAAYFDDEITAMPNLVTTAATTVGALDSGSITSGFGNIDTGSSTITTTGLISGGSLDIDDVLINGSTIGHTDDTDLITVANGLVTVAGEISVTTLDIGGTNVTSTAAELNILDGVTATATELNIMDGVTATTAELNIMDGVTATTAELNIMDGVTATAAEINLIDGGTSRGTTALADGDGILINDAGTMRMTSVETVKTYMSGSAATKGFAIAAAIVFG